MSSYSKITVESLYEKVVLHARKIALKNNRSIHGYIRDLGHHGHTYDALCRERIPKRQKFSLFLELLVDYLNTNQINIEKDEKRNR